MPAADVVHFFRELDEAATKIPEEGSLTRLAAVLAAWRHTAEVYADPELLAALSQPASDFGSVPEPTAR